MKTSRLKCHIRALACSVAALCLSVPSATFADEVTDKPEPAIIIVGNEKQLDAALNQPGPTIIKLKTCKMDNATGGCFTIKMKGKKPLAKNIVGIDGELEGGKRGVIDGGSSSAAIIWIDGKDADLGFIRNVELSHGATGGGWRRGLYLTRFDRRH